MIFIVSVTSLTTTGSSGHILSQAFPNTKPHTAAISHLPASCQLFLRKTISFDILLVNLFDGFLEFEGHFKHPGGGVRPLGAVLYIYGMVEEDAARLAGITELYVFTNGFFEDVSVLFKAVENLFVAGDIKASINLLFLGVDVQTDVIGRRAEAEVIPVTGLGLT